MDEDSQICSKFVIQETNTVNEEFVANGSTSVCYKVQYYGKWLFKKRLKKEFRDNQIYVSAFRKEFELGLQLEHPNIVRYVDVKEDEDGVFIVTDYVDGKSLSSFMCENPNYFKLSANRKLFIKEILSAVDYLHQHQILHLDLKPDNIMMTNIGHHVKLIDLGYSYQDCFTQNTGGTQKYSAPEQFSKKYPLTPACDIYALGNIFQEFHIVRRSVFRKCLKENPKDRYQSVAELRKAIENIKPIYILLSIMFFIAILILFFSLLPNSNIEIKNSPQGEAGALQNVIKQKTDVSKVQEQQQNIGYPKSNASNSNNKEKEKMNVRQGVGTKEDPVIFPPLNGEPAPGMEMELADGRYVVITDKTTQENIIQDMNEQIAKDPDMKDIPKWYIEYLETQKNKKKK